MLYHYSCIAYNHNNTQIPGQALEIQILSQDDKVGAPPQHRGEGAPLISEAPLHFIRRGHNAVSSS